MKDPFNVGQDIVVPEIKGRGIKTIDVLVLTHGDRDHFGGVRAVLNELNVEILAVNVAIREDPTVHHLLRMARHKGIKIRWLKAGNAWQMGSATFTVLAANKNLTKVNNRSIVIRAKFAGISWLFTGDLEIEGERRLIETARHLRSTVLKVGHHGSETSTSPAFLKAVQPEIAVISVGEYNRYGHPAPGVLKKLRKIGAKIYRTDEHGAIRFLFTKKKVLRIETLRSE